MKEAIWLRGLDSDLGLIQDVTAVFCDSQSAIHLTNNQMHHERTKHIDVRRHFVRDIVADNIVTVKKIDTTHNPADMLKNQFLLLSLRIAWTWLEFIHHKPYLTTMKHFLIHYIFSKYLSQDGDL